MVWRCPATRAHDAMQLLFVNGRRRLDIMMSSDDLESKFSLLRHQEYQRS